MSQTTLDMVREFLHGEAQYDVRLLLKRVEEELSGDLARDSERYRWLRSRTLFRDHAQGGIPWPVVVVKENGVPTIVGCFMEELDAAIDLELSKATGVA